MNRLKTKAFWVNFIVMFVLFTIISTLIIYFIDRPELSFKFLAKKILVGLIFAFFMGFIYKLKGEPKVNPD